MARLPRLYAPGCAHHMIQRGNNREDCFRAPADSYCYLEFLREAADACGVAVHAYVLMTNHVHLLVSPESEQSCGRMMQSIGRRYVRYFNDRYHRTGTLWEGRYKSTLVDSDLYFLTVARYIELNPVRAGMVSRPVEYPWSSFHENGLGKGDPLLTHHPLYIGLASIPAERQRRYRAMFDDQVCDNLINDLREATNKGWAFGGKTFKERIAVRANRSVESSGWGGDRRSGGGSRSLTP